MATLQPIRCVDDCGNVPARVDHAPAQDEEPVEDSYDRFIARGQKPY